LNGVFLERAKIKRLVLRACCEQEYILRLFAPHISAYYRGVFLRAMTAPASSRVSSIRWQACFEDPAAASTVLTKWFFCGPRVFGADLWYCYGISRWWIRGRENQRGRWSGQSWAILL